MLTSRNLLKNTSIKLFRNKNNQIRTLISSMPIIPLSEKFPNIPNPIQIKPDQFNQKLATTKLPNGLTIASIDSFEPTATIGILVNAGSRNESSELFGQAHILEKMAFKASESTSSFAIAQALERMGAHVHAQTSRDTMMFYAEVLRKFSKDTINLLHDTFANPALYTHELVNVKADYINLIESQHANDPEIRITEDIHEAAYGLEGLGLPLHANRKCLDLITSKTLRQFIDKHFVANRVTIVGVGVDHHSFCDQINTYFSSLKSGDVSSPEKAKYLGQDIRVHSNDASQPTHACIALETCDWKSDDIVPVCVLQSLMGGGNSFSVGGPGKGMYSRLYLNVLNREHWALSFNAYSSIHNDSGLFGVYGSSEAKYSKNLVNSIIYELRQMANPDLMTEECVNRAKNAVRSSVLVNLENQTIEFEDIGKQLLTYGKRIPVEEVLMKIDQVKKEDLLRVAVKMLKSKPSVVIRGNCSSTPNYHEIEHKLKCLE